MNLKLETYLRGKLLLLLNCWITQKVSRNLKLGLDLEILILGVSGPVMHNSYTVRKLFFEDLEIHPLSYFPFHSVVELCYLKDSAFHRKFGF